jgi:hypothetical protein
MSIHILFISKFFSLGEELRGEATGDMRNLRSGCDILDFSYPNKVEQRESR